MAIAKKIIIILLLILICLTYTNKLFANQDVNLVVPPRNSDYQLSIITDAENPTHQFKTFTYAITYGALSSSAFSSSITIQADFNEDTQDGIHTTDYVFGSATAAYNKTPAVVDLTHRIITWTIPNVPPGTTDQTVTFQLRTNSDYTGPNQVGIVVKAKLSNQYVTLPTVSVGTVYTYLASSQLASGNVQSSDTPTPQPTTVITNTPEPIVTKTAPSAFVNITLLNVTSNTADIEFIVRQKGKVTILYGTSPYTLNKTQIITTDIGTGIFSLKNLTPEEKYYFQLFSTGDEGSFSSDIFSFAVPSPSLVAEVNPATLVIATPNDILYSALLNNSEGFNNPLSQTPLIPVASTTNYTLAFKLTKQDNISSVILILQNNSVLGIATPAFAQTTFPKTYQFLALSRGNGVYISNIDTNTLPSGTYMASIRVQDKNGNITTQKVANIHILEPFRISDSTTKSPIKYVRISIYQKNLLTQQYTRLTRNNSITNPLYTDSNGVGSEQLPTGSYKVILSHLGYIDKTVYFSIGTSPQDNYPQVFMDPTPVTLGSVFNYYLTGFSDWIPTVEVYASTLNPTNRSLNFIGIVALFCLVVLTLLFFRITSHIAFSQMHFFLHHHALRFTKFKNPYIHGKVVDKKTSLPLSDVTLFVRDNAKRILFKTTTNKNGTFVLPEKFDKYPISLLKDGFEEEFFSNASSLPAVVSLSENNEITAHPKVSFFIGVGENLAGAGFAFLLVLCFILELLFTPYFGIYATMPLLVISFINLNLWAFYYYESRRN